MCNGLNNNPICRKCVNEEETSVHVLFECEALASLIHSYLGCFFLDPEDIRKLNIGGIWNFGKEQGYSNLVQNMGHKGLVLRTRCIEPGRARNQTSFNSVQFISIQFNSFQISSVQFNSVQFNSNHFSSVQFSSIQFKSVQLNSIQFNSIQISSVQFNSIQFNSIQSNQFNSIQGGISHFIEY